MAQENEYIPRNSYQDNVHEDPDTPDPLMQELSENPADELGVPQSEYDDEFNDSEMFHEPDDARENTEDLDEDQADDTKAA